MKTLIMFKRALLVMALACAASTAEAQSFNLNANAGWGARTSTPANVNMVPAGNDLEGWFPAQDGDRTVGARATPAWFRNGNLSIGNPARPGLHPPFETLAPHAPAPPRSVLAPANVNGALR